MSSKPNLADHADVVNTFLSLLSAPILLSLFSVILNLLNEVVASWLTLIAFTTWLIFLIVCFFKNSVNFNKKQLILVGKLRFKYSFIGSLLILIWVIVLWVPVNHIDSSYTGIRKTIFDENDLIYGNEEDWRKAFEYNAIITIDKLNSPFLGKAKRHYENNLKAKKNSNDIHIYRMMKKHAPSFLSLGDASKFVVEKTESKTVSGSYHNLNKDYWIRQTINEYYDFIKNHKDPNDPGRVYKKVVSNSSVRLSEKKTGHYAIAISHDQYRYTNYLRLYARRLLGSFKNLKIFINKYEPYKEWEDKSLYQVWKFKLDPANDSWKILEFHGGLDQNRVRRWYALLKSQGKWDHLDTYSD